MVSVRAAFALGSVNAMISTIEHEHFAFELIHPEGMKITQPRVARNELPWVKAHRLPTLKELMGHSNISTTMRYVHPTPEHKLEAVRKLENFNALQVITMHENRLGSPQKSPQ